MSRGARIANAAPSDRISGRTHDPRISLERCREILGPSVELADEDLEALRDQLSTLAEIVLDAFQEQGDQEQDDEEQRH